MLRSGKARTRAQSVRDVLEVDLALTLGRLSHGDDVDVVALFRMNDGHGDLAKEAQAG